MQEEIEHKTVNLAISTTKLSARTLLRGMQFLLRQYDKHASQGKQSMKRLVQQNRGVTNVEIQKTGIKYFDRYKRYHIDYSIQKDLSCTPPRYLIYFKAQDTDALAQHQGIFASVMIKPSGLPCWQSCTIWRSPLQACRTRCGTSRRSAAYEKKKLCCWRSICPMWRSACWQPIWARHGGWPARNWATKSYR